MAKFKQGDRVEVIEHSLDVKIGEQGIIICRDSLIPDVKWDNKSISCDYCISEDKLKLIDGGINYHGRYIKVLKKCLGGDNHKYDVGDYLKIISDDGVDSCFQVQHAGSLRIRGGNPGNTRVDLKHIELMPVGFVPNIISYEIY